MMNDVMVMTIINFIEDIDGMRREVGVTLIVNNVMMMIIIYIIKILSILVQDVFCYIIYILYTVGIAKITVLISDSLSVPI